MEKHKFASLSLTVRDRAIPSKFSTHRVLKKCTIGNFQKIFLSPKLAAILNFCQKWKKHKFASISLTVRDRVILSKFSSHRVAKKCTFYCINTSYPMDNSFPVGADRPAKRQKKTSCVSTGRSVPSTSALARWRVVLPSCLDRVTS